MFDKDTVKNIAKLSLLELTDEEINTFSKQFSQIMGYFELLNSTDLEIDKDFKSIDDQLKTGRADVQVNSKIKPSDFSNYVEEKCFIVPKVIDSGN